MNEQAYQDQMDDDAQFEAEQEELREVACAKYEDYKPLLDEISDLIVIGEKNPALKWKV